MSTHKTKILVGALMGLLVLPVLSFGQGKKQFQKSGVPADQDESEANSASIVIGFNLNSFSLGEDPCTRGAKNKFSPKSKHGEITLGKLPSKPSVQVGRSGLAMEGETAEYSAENVCYEGYDSQGNKCVEATANSDGSTTFKNNSESKCTVQIGENTTLNMDPKTEVTVEPPKEPTTGEKILRGIGKAWLWVREATGADSQKQDQRSKTAVAGVRGQCDPFGVTGGCRVDKGSAWVAPPWLNPMGELREAEESGLVEKLRWQRVNPSPDSPAIPPGGPTPSKTYPGESAKSGFEKEKESKISKGGQITYPSGERGTGHPKGFDFCGRHLLSPEEYARMGFDPGRITDPADRSWNGRIEQVQNERTLVWSKTIKRSDGTSVKVEKRYKDGSISSLSYQFYDKKGEKIGYINYDSRTGKIDGVRLK